MPFAITNWFFFFLFDFWHPLPEVWNIAKTHYKPKNENHCMGMLDSSNEAFWCTDSNAKNPSSLGGPISLKIKKNRQKMVIFEKWKFLAIFLDFFQNGTSQRAGVFCVVISASKRFIWAIKHPHQMIFIFWLIMGFLQFYRPLVAGVKCENFVLKKIFSVFIWHKASKNSRARKSLK